MKNNRRSRFDPNSEVRRSFHTMFAEHSGDSLDSDTDEDSDEDEVEDEYKEEDSLLDDEYLDQAEMV